MKITKTKSIPTTVLAGASVDTVVNAGAATNQGFEVEATWLVGDYFTLGGNYSYTDTEYSESYLGDRA